MRRLLLLCAAPLLVATGCTVRGVVIAPACEPNQRLAIVAQSVPSATAVPCVRTMLPGWSAGGVKVRRGVSVFWLNSDRAGDRAAEVTVTRECDTSSARGVASRESGVKRFETVASVGRRVVWYVFDVFDGGCVTSRFNLPTKGAELLAAEADDIIALYPRDRLRADIRERSGIDIGPAKGSRAVDG